LDHLTGVQQVLESWNEREEICLAGLYHSIYGSELFVRNITHLAFPKTLSSSSPGHHNFVYGSDLFVREDSLRLSSTRQGFDKVAVIKENAPNVAHLE
jgi:hypothetical protein